MSNSSEELINLIKNGSIKRQLMLNIDITNQNAHLIEFQRFLKSLNFALLLKCEGNGIYK